MWSKPNQWGLEKYCDQVSREQVLENKRYKPPMKGAPTSSHFVIIDFHVIAHVMVDMSASTQMTVSHYVKMKLPRKKIEKMHWDKSLSNMTSMKKPTVSNHHPHVLGVTKKMNFISSLRTIVYTRDCRRERYLSQKYLFGWSWQKALVLCSENLHQSRTMKL